MHQARQTLAVTFTHRIMCYYSQLQKGDARGMADFGHDLHTHNYVLLFTSAEGRRTGMADLGSDLYTHNYVIIHMCRREVHQVRQTLAVTFTHIIMCYYSHLQKGDAQGEADFGSDLYT